MKHTLLFFSFCSLIINLFGQSQTKTANNIVVNHNVASWLDKSVSSFAADDNKYAYTKKTSGQHPIFFDHFGFSIPTDATITQISATVRKFKKGKSEVKDLSGVTWFIKSCCNYGPSMNDINPWPLNETAVKYEQPGSGVDEQWKNYTWTPEDINDPLFGFTFNPTVSIQGGGAAIYIDQLSITVYYTLPASKVLITTSNTNESLGIPSASNCGLTENYPTDCTGTNVTKDFNSDYGGFTSNEFKWDARKGNWKASKLKANQVIYITSGIYELIQDGTTNFGFTSEGIHRKDVEILDANTGEILTVCAAVGGQYPTPNQVCLILPLETDREKFFKGRLIKYRVKFINGSSWSFSATATFDNFSVGGSAEEVTSSSAKVISALSGKQFVNSKIKPTELEHSIFPNPFKNQALLLFKAVESGNSFVEVYNIQGAKLKTINIGNLLKGQTYNFQINLSGLSSGTYLYQLRNGKSISKGSLIKQN